MENQNQSLDPLVYEIGVTGEGKPIKNIEELKTLGKAIWCTMLTESRRIEENEVSKEKEYTYEVVEKKKGREKIYKIALKVDPSKLKKLEKEWLTYWNNNIDTRLDIDNEPCFYVENCSNKFNELKGQIVIPQGKIKQYLDFLTDFFSLRVKPLHPKNTTFSFTYIQENKENQIKTKHGNPLSIITGQSMDGHKVSPNLLKNNQEKTI